MTKRKQSRKRGTKSPVRLTRVQLVLLGKGPYRSFKAISTVNHP